MEEASLIKLSYDECAKGNSGLAAFDSVLRDENGKWVCCYYGVLGV